jgi:hypothetical protein
MFKSCNVEDQTRNSRLLTHSTRSWFETIGDTLLESEIQSAKYVAARKSRESSLRSSKDIEEESEKLARIMLIGSDKFMRERYRQYVRKNKQKKEIKISLRKGIDNFIQNK